MRKIIITADDYGLSPAVNQAIEEGMAAGVITSTNVMMGMDYCEAAKDLKRKFPNVSVGLHWTLTEGSKPVSAPADIPSLVDANGRFYMLSEFYQRYKKHLIRDEDIRKEYIAQYSKFERLIGKPDYWNSHQNTHVRFGVFDIALKTACELGMTKMRSNQRVYVPSSDPSRRRSLKWRLMEPMKSLLMDYWHGKAHKRGIKTPDGIILCLNPEDEHNLEHIFNNIKWGHHRIAEVVMHPATHVDTELMGTFTDIRIKEYKLFCSQEAYDVIRKANIELVSYEEL